MWRTSGLTHFRRKNSVWFLARATVFLGFLVVSSSSFAAGGDKLSPDQLDALITDLRVNLFKEPVDQDGRPTGKPGLTPDQITPELVNQLYGRPGALKAIGRIFASTDYADINRRLGDFRESANLRIWTQIVDRFGIRIELNNAGKRNGAVSDLDNTLFTDAKVLIIPETGQRLTDPAEIHKFLIEEHGRLWESEFGVKPIAFDAMHFQGDGLMQDWRMSKRSLFQFVAQMESDIARLSSVDGAYFIPGAYKPQVYGRYLREAGTFVIEPHLDPKKVSKRVDIEGAAKGVLVRTEAHTRQASHLYRDIPFNLDRTGALGALLGNVQYADATSDKIKDSKYRVRGIDALISSFTNLEVDWRHLLLAGKDSIRQYHVDKLFRDLKRQGLIPPEIGDTKEARRVMDLMTRIELDKIIRGYKGKPRPDFWSDEWKAYVPREIDKLSTKKEYYATELEEIRRSLPPDTPPPSEERLIAMAEEAFSEKARAIARMSASVAAKRIFTDVFTREGFARQVHLHGLEAAERLVAERLKGLHAALAFQTDDQIIRNIRDAAPPETRQVIDMIVEIAEAQRRTVLERGSITGDELKLSNRALIKLLDQVSKQLRLEIPDEFSKRAIATVLRNELLRTDRTYAGRLLKSAKAQVTTYFNPLRQGPRTFFLETGRNLWDIGSVDNVARVIAFNVQGRNDLAALEGVNAITSAVPIAKDIWAIANGIKAWQSGDPSLFKRTWPMAEFTALKAFTNLGGVAAEFATLYGFAKVLYGIEKSLFDVGWHFYGKPTQNEAVSWVLMGHPRKGVYLDPYEDRKQGIFSGIVGKQSRFPPVPDGAAALLRQHAILKNKVDIPKFPRDLTETLMRGAYLVRANKDTLAAGITTATLATFQNARERYLAEYVRKSDYYLRRMYLYQAAHIDFFRYAQNFQKNFQMISADPPTKYLNVPQHALVKEYPDAVIKRGGGRIDWDHERIFLRDYFKKWLREWKRTQLPANLRGRFDRSAEAGFFISTANNVAPWWEKAVVDDLMSAYFEGEMWDIGRPEVQLKRHAQVRAANALKAKLGGDKMRQEFERQVNEARGKEYRKMKLLEALRWHPELRNKLVDALMAAAKARAEDYKPKSPELRVKIPRPVARLGKPMVIEASVTGDVKTLPNDFRVEVRYRKVREHRKRRPPGVLRDDVRQLLGSNVADKDLTVHEHKAQISLVSKSQPDFRVGPVTRTVFWLGGRPIPAQLFVIIKISGSGYNYDEKFVTRGGKSVVATDANRIAGYETRVLRVPKGKDSKAMVRALHKQLSGKRCGKRPKGFMRFMTAKGKKSKNTPMLWYAGAPKIEILPLGPYTGEELEQAKRSGAFKIEKSYRVVGERKWECPQ